MSIRFRTPVLAALAAATASVTALAASAATPKLQGVVGPGFTIHLAQSGKNVSRLRPGAYVLVVSDKSPIHDFHLSGPGVNKVVTSVSFVGEKTINVTLKKGTYSYVCDPHRAFMHGSFRVS